MEKKRLQSINESIREVQTILGPMYIREDENGPKEIGMGNAPLSTDMKPAQFNVALKKLLKSKGVQVESVRIVNSYNWPKCYVQVYGKIPNDVRLDALHAAYPNLKAKDPQGKEHDLGVRDMNDINYGNITSGRVSLHAKDWVTALVSSVKENAEDGKRSLSDILTVLLDDFGDEDKRDFAKFLLEKYSSQNLSFEVDYDEEFEDFTKGGMPQN